MVIFHSHVELPEGTPKRMDVINNMAGKILGSYEIVGMSETIVRGYRTDN